MGALASVSLRRAARATLSADAGLTAALGGAKIFDEVPRATQPPYVTFGDAQWRDWSTASDRGGEHVFVLDVWTEQRGLRQALDLAERVAGLLDGAALALDGHRLVDLRLEALDTRREANGRFARAALRFRALTETI